MFCEFPVTSNSDEKELAIAKSVRQLQVWEYDTFHLWFVKQFTKSLMKPTKYRPSSIRVAIAAIKSEKEKFPGTDSTLFN